MHMLFSSIWIQLTEGYCLYVLNFTDIYTFVQSPEIYMVTYIPTVFKKNRYGFQCLCRTYSILDGLSQTQGAGRQHKNLVLTLYPFFPPNKWTKPDNGYQSTVNVRRTLYLKCTLVTLKQQQQIWKNKKNNAVLLEQACANMIIEFSVKGISTGKWNTVQMRGCSLGVHETRWKLCYQIKFNINLNLPR